MNTADQDPRRAPDTADAANGAEPDTDPAATPTTNPAQLSSHARETDPTATSTTVPAHAAGSARETDPTTAPTAGPANAGSGAREEVLRRVRAVRPTSAVAVTRGYDAGDGPGGGALVELFVDRLEDYRATVRTTTPAELAGAVGALLHGVPRVVVPAGVPGEWLAGFGGTVARDGSPEALTVGDLDEPGVAVVTGCAVAIAETGTLILDAGPEQGRRQLTLVPDHHVCVVRADQVVARVPAALRRLADPTRPLTLISGPSATSDIELRRVEGVHGPRRLDVVVVV